MIALDFKETCLIYPTTMDGYGKTVLQEPASVPCMYEQTTAYQHSGSQDAVTGTPRLVLPMGNAFLEDHGYRLEEMVVQVNPFGVGNLTQRFKIASVTPGRDLLLGNEVTHVECDLQKVEVDGYVS